MAALRLISFLKKRSTQSGRNKENQKEGGRKIEESFGDLMEGTRIAVETVKSRDCNSSIINY